MSIQNEEKLYCPKGHPVIEERKVIKKGKGFYIKAPRDTHVMIKETKNNDKCHNTETENPGTADWINFSDRRPEVGDKIEVAVRKIGSDGHWNKLQTLSFYYGKNGDSTEDKWNKVDGFERGWRPAQNPNCDNSAHVETTEESEDPKKVAYAREVVNRLFTIEPSNNSNEEYDSSQGPELPTHFFVRKNNTIEYYGNVEKTQAQIAIEKVIEALEYIYPEKDRIAALLKDLNK